MKILICVFLVMILHSCGESKPRVEFIDDKNLNQEQIDSVMTEFKFEYANPLFIDSSDLMLIPITTQKMKSKRSRELSGYYGESYPRYWNILFYNKNTGATCLLTESKYRISDFSLNIKHAGEILTKSILYTICDNDYNKNGKLNEEDPAHLFISKNDGSQLSRLSPINEFLKSYTVIPDSDQIIIKTKRDVDGNLKFDKEDEDIWYRIDLQTDSLPVEIVSEQDRKRIKNIYFNQWLMKKEE